MTLKKEHNNYPNKRQVRILYRTTAYIC